MALPEILINSPTPGTREALTTLELELSESGTEMTWVANVPVSLQKEKGQFRVIIGSEIILCEARAESTKKVKILERGAESSTKTKHEAGSKIYSVPTASALENFIVNKIWKNSVVAATTEALPANTVSGEKIIASENGALSFDGGSWGTGERVLVKNQTESQHNGIYTITHPGGVSEKWELTRTTDANTPSFLMDAVVIVGNGTNNKGTQWIQRKQIVTVGTSEQEWVPISTAGPRLVSALPSLSPADGEIIYFQNAAMAEAGVVWTLRYRSGSSSTHKWEFVGGAPLEARQGESGAQETAAIGTYTEMVHSPKLSAPLAGDYKVMAFGSVQSNNEGAHETRVRVNEITPLGWFSTTANFFGGVTGGIVPGSFTAAQAITLGITTDKSKYNFGNIAAWALSITPVRVG